MSAALTCRVIQSWPRLSRLLSQSSLTQLNALLPKTLDSDQLTCLRTSESNPANHTVDNVAAYYTIPQNEAHIFQLGGFPKPFMLQCSTFTETCLMIRKPAVEVIQYLKSADYNNPLMKYVLYGKPGLGKSITLTHILHYAFIDKWILVHVPWVGNWLRSPREVVNSTTRPGYVDLPENAVRWLLHFKTQNQTLIKELDLRLANDYEWSKRELSKVGDPLLDIVELGLNRSRHASEIIIALLKEIKTACKSGKCKALIAVDGFNAFFHTDTNIRNEEKMMIPPEKVSFIPAFLDATKSDWHNSAAVLTCDELVTPGHEKSPLPIYQLKMQGFHHLSPFVPISVSEMTEVELKSMLAYYKERRWLQNWQADDELVFLSGGNPYKLMNLCNPL